MAEVMKVFVERSKIGNGGDIHDALSDFLPEDCAIYFKDGCEVSVDGKDEPDKLLDIARKWNENIQNEAQDAIRKWEKSGFLLDSAGSFEARIAVQASDNYFNPNGMNYRTVVDPTCHFPFFSVLIKSEMMQLIEAHPEDFVIVDAVYDF